MPERRLSGGKWWASFGRTAGSMLADLRRLSKILVGCRLEEDSLLCGEIPSKLLLASPKCILTRDISIVVFLVLHITSMQLPKHRISLNILKQCGKFKVNLSGQYK